MALTNLNKGKRGAPPNWQARWRLGGKGPVQSMVFGTDYDTAKSVHEAARRKGWALPKEEALAAIGRDDRPAADGRSLPRSFRAFAEAVLTDRDDMKPASVADYLAVLDNHFAEWRTRDVASITVKDVTRRFSVLRATGLAESTLGGFLARLGAIFAAAVECRFRTEDPTDEARKVLRLAPTPFRGLALEAAGREAVLAAARTRPGSIGLMVWLAMVTGLRFGELAALTRQDFDLKVPGRAAVHVHRQVDSKACEKAGTMVTAVPKYRSIRTVPIRDLDLIAALREHLLTVPLGTVVFTSPRGRRYWTVGTFKQHWQAIRKALSEAGHDDLVPVRPHDLRHTAATWWLRECGVQVAWVSTWLGHCSVALTEKVYIGETGDPFAAMWGSDTPVAEVREIGAVTA